MQSISINRKFPWLLALLLTACTKMPVSNPSSPAPPVANMAEAKERLRSLRPLSATTANDYTVLAVHNYSTGDRSISLVTYTNEEGHQQTVAYVTRPDGQGGLITDTVTCESSSCNCAIEIYEKPDGNLDLRCSCTPCTMVVR